MPPASYAAAMGHAPFLGALLVVAATFGFAACGSAGEGGCSENASYASVVRFNGVLYTGSALPEGGHVNVGRSVGTGSDACGSEVTVRAIAGVPPAAAVAMAAPGETQTDDVYLAPGFLPAMPSHPLHAALFDERPRADRLRHRCRQATHLDGVAESISGFGRLVMAGRNVFFGRRTRYRGPRRAGLPYLRGGERVVVRGWACRGTRVVAQFIRARR
jgi:hypothetical protein